MKRSIVWPLVVDDHGAFTTARQQVNCSSVGQAWARLMASLFRFVLQAVHSILAALNRHTCHLASKLEHNSNLDSRPAPLDSSVPWISQLEALGYSQVMDLTALLNSEGVFPDDHLFRMFAQQGMLIDVRVFMKAPFPQHSDDVSDINDIPSAPHSATDACHPASRCRIVSINHFGHGVCGHPGIMHGGMTAAVIDETCGALLYKVREQGLLDFKFVVTASLQVQYKQPATPSKPVVVTAWVTEVSGRKIWVDVVASDTPYDADHDTQLLKDSHTSSSVYATAKALFIIPRPEGNSTSVLQQHGGQHLLGGHRGV